MRSYCKAFHQFLGVDTASQARLSRRASGGVACSACSAEPSEEHAFLRGTCIPPRNMHSSEEHAFLRGTCISSKNMHTFRLSSGRRLQQRKDSDVQQGTGMSSLRSTYAATAARIDVRLSSRQRPSLRDFDELALPTEVYLVKTYTKVQSRHWCRPDT